MGIALAKLAAILRDELRVLKKKGGGADQVINGLFCGIITQYEIF